MSVTANSQASLFTEDKLNSVVKSKSENVKCQEKIVVSLVVVLTDERKESVYSSYQVTNYITNGEVSG